MSSDRPVESYCSGQVLQLLIGWFELLQVLVVTLLVVITNTASDQQLDMYRSVKVLLLLTSCSELVERLVALMETLTLAANRTHSTQQAQQVTEHRSYR